MSESTLSVLSQPGREDANPLHVLLAFYDYPAEHRGIRTTNPIESTFATARLRTKRSRNCGSRATTLAIVFKVLRSVQKRWKRIRGFRRRDWSSTASSFATDSKSLISKTAPARCLYTR